MKRAAIVLMVLLGIVYLLYAALIYYDNNFIYGRMRETPAVKPLEEPPLIMAEGIVPVSGGEMQFKTVPAEKLESPLAATPAVIGQGKTLYFTFCAQCHGEYYDGNGTVGQSFAPLPTDLRSARVQSLPDGVLFKEISYGIPKGRQPPLAATIAETDRWRIISYVKSLGIRN